MLCVYCTSVDCHVCTLCTLESCWCQLTLLCLCSFCSVQGNCTLSAAAALLQPVDSPYRMITAAALGSVTTLQLYTGQSFSKSAGCYRHTKDAPFMTYAFICTACQHWALPAQPSWVTPTTGRQHQQRWKQGQQQLQQSLLLGHPSIFSSKAALSFA